MTREQTYEAQMRALGIWQDAFKPEVHTLCMMERELQRMVKDWKAKGSPVVDYNDKGTEISSKRLDAINAHRRDILARKDALGLTPRSLRRFRAQIGEEPQAEDPAPTVLEILRAKRRA